MKRIFFVDKNNIPPLLCCLVDFIVDPLFAFINLPETPNRALIYFSQLLIRTN